MKSIMYNEHYGLESATLNGSKVRTLRDELNPNKKHSEEEWGFINLLNDEECHSELSFDGIDRFSLKCNVWFEYEFKTKCKVGEIVAIKQSYKDAGFAPDKILYKSNFFDSWEERFDEQTGWSNKMFVCASLMPHQIQITAIKLERTQNISDEDCLKEGIEYVGDSNSDKLNDYFYHYHNDKLKPEHRHQRVGMFSTPREAFAELIDNISGNGTWERNDYHVVYYYKLIK